MEKKDGRVFIELEWICPNCDSRNKGSRKTCENCGAAQPDNVKFQRAADEKVVADEKSIEAAKAGADIHCGFCGTRNPATATTCSQCGGDLKEGKKREAGQVLKAAPPPPKSLTCANCGTENPGTAAACKQCGVPLKQAAAAPAPAKTAAAPARKVNPWFLGGIGALLLFCCVAAIFWFVLPSKSVKGTVTDLYWQTTTAVQEVQPVNYSNERGSAPSGAYNVSCHTESEEVCEEKTVDQGNGYAEVVQECHTESEQYCDYTLDEWTTIQSYDLSGSDNYPVYEEPNITSDQRVGNTVNTLTVTFSTSDGQKEYTPDSAAEFQQFEIGSVWTLKMNRAGGILSVEP
ncbi:MAG: zinc ribbon domain-containing protein [Chloroflexi bacterium]|nr:zinc ribbon domain-containing protein [Chloroflexota bacterium]